jgi:hypothetical protein
VVELNDIYLRTSGGYPAVLRWLPQQQISLLAGSHYTGIGRQLAAGTDRALTIKWRAKKLRDEIQRHP